MVNGFDNRERNEGPNINPTFYERFNIDIEMDLDEARQRFINRILNFIERLLPALEDKNYGYYRNDMENDVLAYVASKMGRRYDKNDYFSDYSGHDSYQDFRLFLFSVEALYEALKKYKEPERKRALEELIEQAMSMNEIALGVEWRDGTFWPSGAKILDDKLVNEPLQWLSEPKYRNVVDPFKKGLSHYLESSDSPEKLMDTITDMYEALEALARIVTGKSSKTLHSIYEEFISKLSLNNYYKKMLKDYIDYAHEYRHAIDQGKERTPLKPHEVEAFIYITGLFIRLAIQQLAHSSK